MIGIKSSHGGRQSYGGRRADAIIVGAGPAGATTALLLARAGFRPLLVDREPFPRSKPCGDCLSAAATGLLRRLGVLDRVRAAGAAEVESWRIVSPGGVACDGRFDGEPALALERRLLDHALLEAALEAGALRVTGYARDLMRDPDSGAVTGVVIRDPDGRSSAISAPLVVGADGLRSVVARRLGLVRRRPRLSKLSLTTHGCLASTALRRGEMHVLHGGCIGFAPAGPGRFNLTLVVDSRQAGRLKQLGARRFLRERIEQVPSLRDRVRGTALEPPLASGPFDWPVRTAAAAGAALVGDAAGYFDPFTGQGIYHAMAGAVMLADEVVPALRDDGLGAALGRYARRHRRMSRPARRLQRVIDLALRRPRRADRVVRRLSLAPAVMDRLVQVTGNVRPPSSLLSPSLVQTFIFPPAPELR